jgi:hypothetical protein
VKRLLAVTALWGWTLAAQPARPVAARVAQTTTEPPIVKRAAMQVVEKAMDKRLELTFSDDPLLLLGDTRGVYLPGYGVVLTAEVSLVNSPGISPFHQVITADEKARLHAKKSQRLEKLKESVRGMLVTAAADLRPVPLGENVVIGISLFYYHWEDTSGLPGQIVMQATREQLVTQTAASSIKVTEF